MVRDKAVIKPAPGKRKCKCKSKLVTRQMGPGMFQQYTQQVGGTRQAESAVIAVVAIISSTRQVGHHHVPAVICK